MQERGVISYYSARALPEASAFEDWLTRITGLIEADAHSGRLPKTHRPLLRVIGDAAHPLIGSPAAQ
jgi:hypothetical protein